MSLAFSHAYDAMPRIIHTQQQQHLTLSRLAHLGDNFIMVRRMTSTRRAAVSVYAYTHIHTHTYNVYTFIHQHLHSIHTSSLLGLIRTDSIPFPLSSPFIHPFTFSMTLYTQILHFPLQYTIQDLQLDLLVPFLLSPLSPFLPHTHTHTLSLSIYVGLSIVSCVSLSRSGGALSPRPRLFAAADKEQDDGAKVKVGGFEGRE